MADKSQIREAQSRLKRSGHYKGEVDGQMNAEFTKALVKFQNGSSDTSTGKLDQQTISALNTKQNGRELYPVEDDFQASAPSDPAVEPGSQEQAEAPPDNGIGLTKENARNIAKKGQEAIEVKKKQEQKAMAAVENEKNAPVVIPKGNAQAPVQRAEVPLSDKQKRVVDEYAKNVAKGWPANTAWEQANKTVGRLIDLKAKNADLTQGTIGAASAEREAEQNSQWGKQFPKGHQLPPGWEPIQPKQEQAAAPERWRGEIEQEDALVRAFGEDMRRKVDGGKLEPMDKLTERRRAVIDRSMRGFVPAAQTPDYANDIKAGITPYGYVGKAAEVVGRALNQAPMARNYTAASNARDAAELAVQKANADGTDSIGLTNSLRESELALRDAGIALNAPNSSSAAAGQLVADSARKQYNDIFSGDSNSAASKVADMMKSLPRSKLPLVTEPALAKNKLP